MELAVGRLRSKVFRTDCEVSMGACWGRAGGVSAGAKENLVSASTVLSSMFTEHIYSTHALCPAPGKQDAVVS